MVVGTVPDANCRVLQAYVRFPGGTITIFDGPGATYSEPLAINPAGAITGYFCSNACHGFLSTPDGVITAFDPPGSFFTQVPASTPRGRSSEITKTRMACRTASCGCRDRRRGAGFLGLQAALGNPS